MAQLRVQDVLREMVSRAEPRPDGSGVFTGSPRYIMERPGSVSSGPLYRALRDWGVIREGRGRTARWIIPPDVMQTFRHPSVAKP